MADTDFKIEIKDFQSLKSVKMTLVPGINVVTGKSNSGKSATIRAINCAVFNIGDDDMVRGGKRYAGVQLDNGRHKMVFCRDSHGKNEKTAYQFDGGVTQKKVGRSQLPEVAKMFNIRDVRMQNNTKMQLNFWLQNEKPFLMDKTSGQLYEFLSLSSCDRYTKVLKRMVVDMKVQEADINNITTEIDTLKGVNIRKQTFVDKNKGFESVYKSIIIANQECSKNIAIGKSIDSVYSLDNRISISKDKYVNTVSKLSKLPIDGLRDRYLSIMQRDLELSSLYKSLSSLSILVNKIRGLKVDLQRVQLDKSKCDDVVGKVSKRFNFLDVEVSKLASLSNLLDRCYSKFNSLEVVRNNYNSLSKDYLTVLTQDNLDSIEGRISDIKEREYLNMDILNAITKINLVKVGIASKTKDYESLLNKIESNKRDLDDLKALAGYCPYCGTVFCEHE